MIFLTTLSGLNKLKNELKSSQLDVDNWIKEHGVRYFNEPTNMAQLTEGRRSLQGLLTLWRTIRERK
jgi:hypothetical protein